MLCWLRQKIYYMETLIRVNEISLSAFISHNHVAVLVYYICFDAARPLLAGWIHIPSAIVDHTMSEGGDLSRNEEQEL